MSVTVKTADLVGLLTDLVKSTADSTLPALHAVQLYTSQDGAWLVGNSTDRFVAAQATAEIVPAPVTAVADAPAEGEPAGILPVILVPVPLVKLILSAIKADKLETTLTVVGECLKAETLHGVTTVPLLGEHVAFPKLTGHFKGGDPAAVGEIAFSADVLDVAQAVAKRRKQRVRMVFRKAGEWTRAHAAVGENYCVLMMPMKHDGDIELPAFHDLPSAEPVTAAA